jgi:XTP/dITP diphosphohydrolase
MEVICVTSNEGKYREVRAIGKKYGINVGWMRMEYFEAQGNDLEEIAKISAELLSEKFQSPFFIEDSGLFIDSLNGFPGPYSSYVFKTIGNEGILKLMKDVEDRSAHFLAVVAYWDGEKVHTFSGRVDGRITDEMRGCEGFGYDPIFEYEGRTFAEMGEEKNEYSHRRKAIEKLFSWLSER